MIPLEVIFAGFIVGSFALAGAVMWLGCTICRIDAVQDELREENV